MLDDDEARLKPGDREVTIRLSAVIRAEDAAAFLQSDNPLSAIRIEDLRLEALQMKPLPARRYP